MRSESPGEGWREEELGRARGALRKGSIYRQLVTFAARLLAVISGPSVGSRDSSDCVHPPAAPPPRPHPPGSPAACARGLSEPAPSFSANKVEPRWAGDNWAQPDLWRGGLGSPKLALFVGLAAWPDPASRWGAPCTRRRALGGAALVSAHLGSGSTHTVARGRAPTPPSLASPNTHSSKSLQDVGSTNAAPDRWLGGLHPQTAAERSPSQLSGPLGQVISRTPPLKMGGGRCRLRALQGPLPLAVCAVQPSVAFCRVVYLRRLLDGEQHREGALLDSSALTLGFGSFTRFNI